MTIETGCDDSGNGCTTLEAAVGDVIVRVLELADEVLPVLL